jgi:nicotinamidase-related amidase
MITYPTSKTALIIVDPFNDFLSPGGKLWENTMETVVGINLIENLKSLIEESRRAGIQVIYAPHHHCTKEDYMNWRVLAPSHAGSKKLMLFEKGSWGAMFHPDLQMKQGDILVQNHWTASGFANTDLDFMLRQHSIEYIVVAGMRANTCIDSTCRYGVELGYHVTLINDGIAAFNWEEIRATTAINFPHYGHTILSTAEFTAAIKK